MKRYILIVLGIAMAVYAYKSFMKPPPVPQAPPPPPPIAIPMPEPAPILNPAQLRKVSDATRDPDQNVRWEAARFLVKLNHPEADEVLFRMLAQDQSPDIRMRVIELLQDRKEPKVVQAMSRALGDTEGPVRSAALRALAKIGDVSAAGAVTDLLKDMDDSVRLEAVKTLRLLQDASDEQVHRKQAEIQEQMRRQQEEERRRAQQKK